jgi:hypothetical protein
MSQIQDVAAELRALAAEAKRTAESMKRDLRELHRLEGQITQAGRLGAEVSAPVGALRDGVSAGGAAADSALQVARLASSFADSLAAGGGSGAAASGGEVDYSRPSGHRKGLKQDVWDAALEASEDGVVRDPGTGEPIDPNQAWELGHKPGCEFSKHQRSAAERGISREQFLDEYNDATQYRPELPESNHNHRSEGPRDMYKGY